MPKTTYHNLPQEVANEISDTPSLRGTTHVLMTALHPMVIFGKDISSITKARSFIPDMIAKAIKIVDDYAGWKCLDVSIVKTSDDKTMLVVFLKEL